jgi:hypothetical protein
MEKYETILWFILFMLLMICVTVILVFYHPYTMNFDFTMDNNTLEAIKSINWSAIPVSR